MQAHPHHHSEQLFHCAYSLKPPSWPSVPAPHFFSRPTKHRGRSAEETPDGRCSAHAAAPRRARRESTANRRSNRPCGDLRHAKSRRFGMSEHLTALRAVVLPAARDGAGRLATSFLTTPARGAWSQIALPRRANAAVHTLEKNVCGAEYRLRFAVRRPYRCAGCRS